jgi:preprotein translocase SecE subunit
MFKNILKIFKLPRKILDFIISVFQEMRLVEWLSRRQTLNLTAVVFACTIIFSILLASLDRIFNLLVSKILTIAIK